MAAIEPSPPEADDDAWAEDAGDDAEELPLPHPARRPAAKAAAIRTTPVFFQMFLFFMTVSSFILSIHTLQRTSYFPG
jgi:hypothetical protein